MAAAAEDLAALEQDPSLRPKTIYEKDVTQGIATPPEESEWENGEEWIRKFPCFCERSVRGAG